MTLPVPYLPTGSLLEYLLVAIFAVAILVNRLFVRTVFQIDASITVRAPLETVFAISADYRNWPKVYPHILAVQLLHEGNGERVLGVHQANRPMVTEVQKLSPNSIEEEGTAKDGTRFKETHLFEAVTDGTLHKVIHRASYKGFHIKGRMAKRYKEALLRSLESEKKAAETTP